MSKVSLWWTLVDMQGNVVVDASLLARANDSVYSAVNVASITAELRATTERLFLEVTSMKDDPMAADAVVSESSIKVDPVVGKYAENRGAAPLGKSFDIVLSMMMNEFWHLKFPATSSVILDGEVSEKSVKMKTFVKSAHVHVCCLPSRTSGRSGTTRTSRSEARTCASTASACWPSAWWTTA